MRAFIILLLSLTLTACSAMMLGGGGGYQPAKDERAASAAAADSRITSVINSAYAADAALSGLPIQVRTYSGTVTLTGTVNTYSERDSAIRLARATSGVNVVDSQLLVEGQ